MRRGGIACRAPAEARALLVLGLGALISAGCGGNPRLSTAEPEAFPVSAPRTPPAVPVVDVPPAEPATTPTADTVVTGVRTEDGEGVTPADRQELVMRARLDRLNVGVVSGGSDVARDKLRRTAASKLAEVGLRVRDLGTASRYDAPSSAYLRSAGAEGFDVLIVLWGSASEADRFGNFYSYEARCRGKMLDPEGGAANDRLVASKSATVRGKRALNAEDAEASALEKAGTELAEHLTDELVRKVEHGGYVMRLVLTGVKSTEELDRIRMHLQSKNDIAEARTVSWSKATRRARLLVRMHPGTKANLAAYLETVPKLKIEVTDLRKRDVSGKRIEDEKRRRRKREE